MSVRALHDLPAPAKLNLDLRVVGRRADGYHLLHSLFVLIDWADVLHVERRADGALHRHDLGVPLPSDDLCLRAARALQRESGTALGADVWLDKRVPWGAGLGGGSSDAATTLLALNRLWQLRWPRERLLALAATIGADVPFFVGGTNAVVEGIGERLTPAEIPVQRYAVVKPAVALATRDVFARYAAAAAEGAAILPGFLAERHAATGGNDLQGIAEQLCPEVAEAARWLQQRYGNALMTGSGSAVFARVGPGVQPEATFPAHELPPGWVGRLCRGLPAHPLDGWAG